jgi:hypothetical protein
MTENTENLREYRTWGMPILLLMVIFMVLGIVGTLIVNYLF